MLYFYFLNFEFKLISKCARIEFKSVVIGFRTHHKNKCLFNELRICIQVICISYKEDKEKKNRCASKCLK